MIWNLCAFWASLSDFHEPWMTVDIVVCICHQIVIGAVTWISISFASFNSTFRQPVSRWTETYNKSLNFAIIDIVSLWRDENEWIYMFKFNYSRSNVHHIYASHLPYLSSVGPVQNRINMAFGSWFLRTSRTLRGIEISRVVYSVQSYA